MIYKLTVRYEHGGATKKEDWKEIFYYLRAKDIQEALDMFNKNLTDRRKIRPQINETIYEIKESDHRIDFIIK